MVRTPKSPEEPLGLRTTDTVTICSNYLAQLVCKSAAFSEPILWTSEQCFSDVLASSERMEMGTLCNRSPIGNSKTLHLLFLQPAIRSAFLNVFFSCASSQFYDGRQRPPLFHSRYCHIVQGFVNFCCQISTKLAMSYVHVQFLHWQFSLAKNIKISWMKNRRPLSAIVQFSSNGTVSYIMWPTSLIVGTLILHLVLGWFTRCLRKQTYCLDVLWAPSYDLYPALISALVLLCQAFLHPDSQTVSVLASGLLFGSFSSPPPAHKLTLASRLCRIIIYIYHESRLFGILKEYVIFLPHSLQCGSSLRPHWCKITGDESVYTQTSARTRF